MQTLLFESAVRATLIAAVIGLVLIAMRIKTASVLHAVWTGVVVVMMLLPAWVAWGPKASIPVLPPDRTPVVALLPPPLPAGLADASPRTSPVRRNGGYALPDTLTVIYFLGFGVLLLRLAIGTIRATRLTSSSCVVPVTVGLLHPRIILPKSSHGWPQAQLDAVLAHESEHVRRRDPLFQWIALLNRALFWFHPLAWWLERRLSGLAEEACDAAVLAHGHDPRDYSEYLLDLARSVERAGTRIEAVGMAMPGIGLKHRIRQMLSGAPIPRISRPRMACAAAVCAASAAILAAGTLVRAQAPQLAFEVASIRPAAPGAMGVGISHPPGRFTGTNVSLSNLMLFAYNVRNFQVSGGPNWVNSDRYDVAAKTQGEDTEDQVRQMVQTLLADRFQLRFHREMKEVPVYALVTGKNGPKLKASVDDGTPWQLGIGPGQTAASSQMLGQKVTMAILANQLSGQTGGRPVLDRTGLAGNYDIKLEWTRDEQQANDSNVPSIFTAIREQLGLKLEATNGLIETLVIDHAEKPSEN
jgi:bla regulator protein BlaR1